MLTFTFTIPSSHGPALKSALDEISNEVGERLVGQHRYEKEEALTRAASALGKLRAAVNAQVTEEDEHYA